MADTSGLRRVWLPGRRDAWTPGRLGTEQLERHPGARPRAAGWLGCPSRRRRPASLRSHQARYLRAETVARAAETAHIPEWTWGGSTGGESREPGGLGEAAGPRGSGAWGLER